MNKVKDYPSPAEVLSTGMFHSLFPDHVVLVPQLNEVYELALAYYESRLLSDEELIERGAYFSKINGTHTHHYSMCTGQPVLLPDHSSSRLKSFFIKNQFRTGYATHGLFPYRGKFHPQMIKALINIMGVKPGEIILDPMMGSGTVPIEASLMGVGSIGFDTSPFCVFMSKVKYETLKISGKLFDTVLRKKSEIYSLFTEASSKILRKECERPSELQIASVPFETIKCLCLKEFYQLVYIENVEIFNFVLLAYLDALGYSERSKRKKPDEQFYAILERYVFVMNKIQYVLDELGIDRALVNIYKSDARSMPLSDNSVDGIIFSPPYSFAIDYLKNDEIHLNIMGEDLNALRDDMIGLRGGKVKEKYSLYIEDMDKVLSECSRVLNDERFCTIIIGTNDNQISKALNIPKESVTGLQDIMIGLAGKYGLSIVRKLERQISGIANTMRNEYILIFKKN